MIVKSFVIGMKVRWWRCSIRKFLEGKMGMDRIPIGILDCFLTTMCTDVSAFIEMFSRPYVV